MRIGHEWCGSVSAVGDGVDEGWIGRRVTGDTMLGCGRCRRCGTGLQHVCEDRFEIGIRGGWPGALAEQLPVPVTALHALPDAVDAVAGALVEPGGNALRAVEGATLGPGARLLVLGPGTIGLLAARFALAKGAEVHVMGLSEPSLDFARTLGVHGAWTCERLPALPFDAVSQGQQRRLDLALALAGRPGLILLDEPTNHLSSALVDELTDAIRATSAAVVVATHDRQLLRDLADWPELLWPR